MRKIKRMQTLKFRTNINCGGCIASATPFLNKIPGISSWNVDIANPSKILTVEGDNIDEKTVADTLAKSGFKATLV